jgi:hypothetical protein
MSASRTLGTTVSGRERSLSSFPGADTIGLKKRFSPNRWAFYAGTGVIPIFDSWVFLAHAKLLNSLVVASVLAKLVVPRLDAVRH